MSGLFPPLPNSRWRREALNCSDNVKETEMQPTYVHDPQRNWLVDMVLRWLTGPINADETFMLYVIAFTLHNSTGWMHQNEPEMSRIGRRAGLGAFFLLIAWYLNFDQGLHNVGSRIIQSISIAWAVAGLAAVLAYPVRTLILLVRAYTQSVNAQVAAGRQKRLEVIRQAETEHDRLEREAARRLEESRAQAEREQQKRAAESRQLVKEQQQREATARREANRQRLAPYKLEVDLAFTRKRVAIEPVMNEKRYQQYFEKYLTDDLSTDEYRQRSERLIKLINDLADVAPRTQKRRDPMAAIIMEHHQRKADLEDLEIDEDTRETLVAAIDEQMEAALQELLR